MRNKEERISVLYSCIVVLMLMIFCLISVSAFSIREVKWTLCDNMNLTKGNCDLWWESPDNPYFIGVSQTNLSTYNKTQLDKRFSSIEKNFTNYLKNFSVVGKINRTEFMEMLNEEIKDKELTSRIEVENIVDRELNPNQATNTSEPDYLLYLLIGVIIIVVLAYGFKTFIQPKLNQQLQPTPRPLVNSIHPRIVPRPQYRHNEPQPPQQPTQEEVYEKLNDEPDIKALQEEIKELKKQAKVK